jgi:PAS domain S-box-containing protein
MLEGRARYAEEAHRWTDVLHNVTYGIGVVDPTNIIMFANAALAAMHGISVGGLDGSPMISLYAPAERERIEALYATADGTGQVAFEADRVRRDGTEFPAEVHITSVRGER